VTSRQTSNSRHVHCSLGVAGALGILLCAFGIGGCFGGQSDTGGDSSITIAQASQPDFLDPALSYTVGGWEPMWLVYTPLLTYRHAEGIAGTELIPGLARQLPLISADGRTYRLTLRPGLRYSNGQGVKASDFEHTIQRVLNLKSGGSSFFQGIQGATKYLRQSDPEADIAGITSDDPTGEIVIRLTRSDPTFENVLAMNFAGMVPADTPFRPMTNDPPPGVGPYQITESLPNRSFVLRRVPAFAGFGIEGVPAGEIDQITTVIMPSLSRETQDVLRNDLDYMQSPPPPDLRSTVEEQAGERFAEHPTASTDFFFLNTQVAPFDDARVREAVNYGVDKPALSRLFSGGLRPGCSYLPPGMPGYDSRLDRAECPYGDPNEPPDLERARALIRAAGAQGAPVTVWGNNDDPIPAVTEAYAEMLNEIGLDATPKLVSGTVYFQLLGDRGTQAQTGFDNWSQDFPHPLSFYSILNGASIQATNNHNLSQVDDPHINSELSRLGRQADLEAVVDDWAALDRYVVSPPQAYLVPFGHHTMPTFLSDRIDPESAVFHPVYYNDYSSWALRADN
jgi:peptide/nickel transport system substrate-binding protein